MAYENIQFTIEAAIARLTLNRPDKLNSFNTAMLSEVRDALSQVTQHEARVLVITGAGRGFCACPETIPQKNKTKTIREICEICGPHGQRRLT